VLVIAATADNYLRAYNMSNGEKLWQARLPAGGQATPMTAQHRHTHIEWQRDRQRERQTILRRTDAFFPHYFVVMVKNCGRRVCLQVARRRR
jgi:hypothetical protein